MESNITNNEIQLKKSFVTPSINSEPVASTVAIIRGRTTGRNKIGNITSLDLVFTEMVENKVPTNDMPKVASTAKRIKDGLYNDKL